jgi:hypothetical protein
MKPYFSVVVLTVVASLMATSFGLAIHNWRLTAGASHSLA